METATEEVAETPTPEPTAEPTETETPEPTEAPAEVVTPPQGPSVASGEVPDQVVATGAFRYTVESVQRALKNAGMSIGDIDLVEINEAFAAQVVPSYQDLGIDIDRLNVNGGSIAVGHPFGMTGARLQNTMLNSLDRHDKTTGLITMCVGGGQGMALVLERM